MIIINHDEDIGKILLERGIPITTPRHKLKYVYRLAGNRCYIDIGEFEDALFLNIISAYGNSRDRNFTSFQSRWYYTVDVYVDIINEFGFNNTFDFSNIPGASHDTYWERPKNYGRCEENLLIGMFMDKLNNNNFGKHYKLI